MQGYLSGRTGKIDSSDQSSDSSEFRPFLDSSSNENATDTDLPASEIESNVEKEVIFDEADCPKVEVVSEDGVPQRIVIHLQDGRLLELVCKY